MRRRSRLLVALAVLPALLVGLVMLAGAGPAAAQVGPGPGADGGPIPTELPSSLPGLPSPAPSPSPSPSASPSPSPAAGSDQASPAPSPSPAPPEVAGPGAGGTGTTYGSSGAMGFDTTTLPGGSAPGAPAAPAPEVAPAAPAPGVGTNAAGPAATTAVAGVSRLAGALPGSFAISALAVVLGVGVLLTTLTLTQRGLLLAHTPDGGIDVETTRRWRTIAGAALLAAAALVGILGYLKISIETLVPVQVVYLASAGFGVIVLAAAGGALLVAEQLRADERRMREIEDSLATLAGHLQPGVAKPARLLDRESDDPATA